MDSERRKATALLAYLAVTRGTYTREQLAALLWPDYERHHAFAYLRRTLWDLNQGIGKTWLQVDREVVRFNQEADFWLDTAAFTGLLAQYRDAKRQGIGGLPFLETAAALYRGDFLSGFHLQDSAEFDDWQLFQAESFRREFAWVLEKLVEDYEQTGKLALALPQAHKWLTLDGLNEMAHRAVMRLYAAMEDRASAVRQYESCVQILGNELDILPQPETTALYEQILRGDFRSEAPEQKEKTLKPENRTLIRLPVPSTPFIGRRMELEQIKSLVLSPPCRLFTLLGPGGAGKTRISIQVALESSGVFSDGVFFVPLDSLNSGDLILPAIAKALDFYFNWGEERPRQQLLEYFREKRILLVLDNFEHLLDAENLHLVSEILSTAPGLKILATSRARLSLQGEYVFSVAGLELPNFKTFIQKGAPEDYVRSFSALELFVTRARRVRPGFQLTSKNLTAVHQICHLVDGMPLGIELASAWLGLLTTQEVAAEISQNFDFLETALKDIPARQRSLRAIFESSWKYLDTAEREVFQKISVFQGGFSREAAHAVSGASLQVLLGLVDKSWLQVDAQQLAAGGGRIHLHDSLRQYANELLKANPAEWMAAKDRHALYYASFAASLGKALHEREQVTALDAIASEFETNLRAAWLWLVEQKNFDLIVRQMLPSLFHFCLIRSLCPELIPLVKQARQAIERESDTPDAMDWAILMTAEIYMEIRYGFLEDTPREKLIKTWRLVKERQLEAAMGEWFVFLAREFAYEIAFMEGRQQLSDAITHLRARVQAGQEEIWVLGWSLMFLGRMTIKNMSHEAGEPYLNEALEIFQTTGALYEQALTLLSLGDATWRQKRTIAESVKFFKAAQDLFDEVDDPFGVAAIWRVLGEIYLQAKDFEQAFQAFKEQGMVYEKIGNRPPPSGSGTFFGSREGRAKEF